MESDTAIKKDGQARISVLSAMIWHSANIPGGASESDKTVPEIAKLQKQH
jgi:hypothetical protein